MELIRKNHNLWDPFEVLEGLQTDINRVFNRSLTRKEGWPEVFSPDIEVHEEGESFILSADLPGLKKEDFEISVQGNRLTLKGERKQGEEKKERGYRYSEKYYGSFTRSMDFPVEIQADKVKASYTNGVLEVTLPKSESSKPRQINIEVR